MTQPRLWIPLFLAGCVWTQVAVSQTGGGFGSPGTTSGTTGSPTTGGTGTTGGTAPDFGTGTGTTGSTPATPPPADPPAVSPPLPPGGGTPSDPFGFGGTTTPTSPFGASDTPGATTTFGLQPRNAAPTPTETAEPVGPVPIPDAAPTYTAPSFYGQAGQTFTAGEGRFTRPRYRYGVSLAMGFDDNTQQTPDDQEDIPSQTIRQVIPAEPEIAFFQTVREPTGEVRFIGGAFRPVFRTVQRKVVLRPAQPEQVIETEIPGIDFPERNSSVVSRLDLNADAQWTKGRSLFVMDLRAGLEYYWSRDQDPLEYNASFATTYLRRITSRMQVTGNLALSYLTQPDYSQVNLVDAPGSGGGYFVTNAKLDLSYRWAARFSTLTSVSGSSIIYQGDRSANNYWEAAIGNEVRYTQSRRTTWVLEARYSEFHYLKGAENVISTIFLLIGSDWTISRRLRMTTRLGQANRSFDTGGKATSPYGEMAVVYQPTRRDQFTLTGRYGFEQTATAEDENVAARISAGYSRTFSPRLLGSLSANYVRNQISNTAGASSTSSVFDGGLLLRYTFSRRFSMNARYSYVLSKTSSGFSDYDRSRFFLTGQYDF